MMKFIDNMKLISLLIEDYIDALYLCDIDKLSKVFEATALYGCIDENGEFLRMTMQEYFPIVDKRTSAKERGEKKSYEIISVDITAGNTAFVKLKCPMAGKDYTDYLTLLKINDEWKIISKVFHFNLI